MLRCAHDPLTNRELLASCRPTALPQAAIVILMLIVPLSACFISVLHPMHRYQHTKLNEDHATLKGGMVVTEAASATELAAIEMWKQGDASLATADKFRQRQALRYDRRVLEELQLFWRTAQRDLREHGDAAADSLDRTGYVAMMRRVCIVMLGPEEEFENAILEDWHRDARGMDTIPRERFCDAFFEVPRHRTRPKPSCRYVMS